MNKLLLELFQDSLRTLENGQAENLKGLHEQFKGLQDQFKTLRDALSEDGKPSAPELHWSAQKE